MKKMRSYKWFSLFLVVVLLCTTVLGCGEKTEDEGSNQIIETDEETSNDGGEENEDASGDDATDEDIDADAGSDTEGSSGNESGDETNSDTENGSTDGTDGESASNGNDNENGGNSSEGNSGGGSSSGDNSGGSSESGSSGGGSDSLSSSELSKGEKMALEIVESIITAGMSDFEKAITIHDWITYNIDYDLTYTNYHLEQTLRDRTGVCQGYAETFNTMAKFAGLDCVFVGGYADNGTGTGYIGHAWNRVKIDGEWYNVDTTWDDPTWDGKSPSDHSFNSYSYFLVSDATLNKDHKVEFIAGNAGAASKDYDRGPILKYAAESNGTEFVESIDAAIAAIERQFVAGNSTIEVWWYRTNENEDTAMIWDGLKCSPALSGMNTSSDGKGLLKIVIPVVITYSEWSAIPVATTNEEFNRICRENVEKGILKMQVRFEPSDPNEAIVWEDWTSAYAIMAWEKTYYKGVYRLFEFTFQK